MLLHDVTPGCRLRRTRRGIPDVLVVPPSLWLDSQDWNVLHIFVDNVKFDRPETLECLKFLVQEVDDDKLLEEDLARAATPAPVAKELTPC